MFDNIGGKIKSLAKFVTWIGIAVSVISGFALSSIGDFLFLFLGCVVAVVGSLLSWAGSFILYAVGQIAQNTDILAGRITLKEIEEYEERLSEQRERLRQEAVVKNKAQKSGIEKSISNYNISTNNDSRETFNYDSNEYIDIYCLNCGEKLSFTYEEIKSGYTVECAFCNASIDLRGFLK